MPRMTLIYARISDTVVAEQYFNATRTVEAQADTPVPPSRTDEREQGARHRRLLGNGHCTRPLELDCRMETICETCAYFDTGPQFVPVLLRQRDHARDHHQTNRARLYDNLITRAKETSP